MDIRNIKRLPHWIKSGTQALWATRKGRVILGGSLAAVVAVAAVGINMVMAQGSRDMTVSARQADSSLAAADAGSLSSGSTASGSSETASTASAADPAGASSAASDTASTISTPASSAGTGSPSTDTGTGNKGTGTDTGNKGTAPDTGNKGAAPDTGNKGTDTDTGNKDTAPDTGNKGTAPDTGNKGTTTNTGTGTAPAYKGEDVTRTFTDEITGISQTVQFLGMGANHEVVAASNINANTTPAMGQAHYGAATFSMSGPVSFSGSAGVFKSGGGGHASTDSLSAGTYTVQLTAHDGTVVAKYHFTINSQGIVE